MARSAILPIKPFETELTIFSNKSSLILFWLLVNHEQAGANGFSINELSRLTFNSVGQVHKVIKQLEYEGIISSKGLRTSKKFYLKSAKEILLSWIKFYNIIKKTKTKGYAISNLDVLNHELAKREKEFIPALHSAAVELFKGKSTNIKTKEYYLLHWDNLQKVTKALHLQELDRGYEILFVKPYYQALLSKLAENSKSQSYWIKAYKILTLLDLCHFPVRGIEQAETLYRREDFLKPICSWSEIENASR